MPSNDSNNQQPLPEGYEFSDLHLRVERALGSGGFGITYLVTDLELNKERVLKENFPRNMAARSSGAAVGVSSSNLREDYDYLLAKFIQEGEALRRFASHPNIAQVLGIFQANNTAYMLMEYRPGQSLGEYIKNRGNRALDEEEIKSLCLPALNGLEAIHAGGLLHLDIKPDNIYLPMLGEPYLIDFGGARRFTSVDSQRLSRYSAMVHTPGYAPGEQSSSQPLYPSTDLYAFGATLYTMISGQVPVDSNNRRSVIEDREPDPLTPASAIGSGKYSPELLRAIDTCLRISRKDRPQSVAELRQLLPASWLSGAAVAPPPPLEPDSPISQPKPTKTATELEKSTPPLEPKPPKPHTSKPYPEHHETETAPKPKSKTSSRSPIATKRNKFLLGLLVTAVIVAGWYSYSINEDTSNWRAAKSDNSIAGYQAYLDDCTLVCPYRQEAKDNLEKLRRYTCIFPDGSGEPAPDWICDMPVPGIAMSAVGMHGPTRAGVSFQKAQATADARGILAEVIKIQVYKMVKGYLDTMGIADAESVDRIASSVLATVSSDNLYGSKVYKSRMGPDGSMYVLAGLDESNAREAVARAVASSMNNDTALWQQFQAQQSFDEMIESIASQPIY